MEKEIGKAVPQKKQTVECENGKGKGTVTGTERNRGMCELTPEGAGLHRNKEGMQKTVNARNHQNLHRRTNERKTSPLEVLAPLPAG